MHLSKTAQFTLADRRARALWLRTRGRTLEDIVRISQAEDWPRAYKTKQAVHADVLRALEEATAERNAAAKDYIEVELQKLDRMEEEAWRVLESEHYVVSQGELVYVYPDEQPALKKQGWARPQLTEEAREALENAKNKIGREPLTDNKPVLDAITVLLKIAERRAKLLGLDAPVKKQVEVTGTEGIQSEIHGIVDVFKAALGIGEELDDDSPDEGQPEPGRAGSG